MEANFDGISALALRFFEWLGSLDLKALNTDIIPQLSNYIRPFVVMVLEAIGWTF